MSRIRLALLTAVVAMFVSVAAASAQAHEFRVAGAGVAGLVELKENKESVISQELKGTPFGVSTQINCKKTVTTGSINTGGTGTANLNFTECTVAKPANCTVKEPIETKVNTLLVGPTPGVQNEFKPAVGETFTTITLEGASCSIKEPFNVTGTQTCNLPGGETEAVAHKIECTTTGSKLKAGGKAATFKGGVEELELVGSKKWSAV
jgi:hypothetical protein